MSDEIAGCEDCPDVETHFERAVDSTAWNGSAAMSNCAKSSTPASCYQSICAGRRAGDPSLQETWALPHHRSPGSPPNAGGVRNALARLSQTDGLTNREEARRHLERHLASIQSSASAVLPLPRDGLFRALPPSLHPVEFRAADNGDRPTLFGHFARFNEWTEINSAFEGRFMERIAPGAFAKTMSQNRGNIKVLFQHGRDPALGDQVLGAIRELREDDEGAFYEVELFDGLPELVMSGLRANQYGASFRFRVVREDVEEDPRTSDENPDGIPERTIREAAVMEFGPVTFPAYAGATAGVRSFTDKFVLGRFMDDPERTMEALSTLDAVYDTTEGDAAASEGTPVTTTTSPETITVRAGTSSHPDPGTSPRSDDATPKEETMGEEGTGAQTPETSARDGLTLEELVERNKSIKARMEQMAAETGTRHLSKDEKDEWEHLDAEFDDNERRIAKVEKMRRRIEQMSVQEERVVPGSFERKDFGVNIPFADQSKRGGGRGSIYDLSSVRSQFTDPEGALRELRDRAHVAIDEARAFPEGNVEGYKDRAHHLVEKHSKDDWMARRVLTTGAPGYEEAFWRKVGGKGLTSHQENLIERAMTTATEGNIAVPFALDPTVILTSDGSANPLRQISRVETITTHTWKGVASTSMSLGYAGEAVEVGDDSTTLSQPELVPLRADAFVPFSVELEQDWAQLRTELTRLTQDGKDILETTMFALGTGVPSQPQGVLIGAGTFVVNTAGTAALAVGDLYNVEADLGPRYRNQRTAIIGSKFVFNQIRTLDTTGGAALWVRLGAGQPPELLGYPAYEQSAMAASLAAGGTILCIGDFSRFLIVDRVGMDVEIVQHMFGTANNRPTGQRGFLAIWRNSSVVLNAGAFRKLKTLS